MFTAKYNREKNRPWFRASECSVFAARGRAKDEFLTKGAKTLVKDYWLRDFKGFSRFMTNKYVKKGIQMEESAITLVSKLYNKMYNKNEIRKFGFHLTGECDILEPEEIVDIKCPWDAKTFINAELDKDYEYQLRAYMHLYDRPVSHVYYVLVDCPEDVYQDEYRRFCWQNNIIDDHLPEYQDALEEFKRTLIYPPELYTEEERVKVFTIERDLDLEEKLLDGIEEAVDYYWSLKLNHKE